MFVCLCVGGCHRSPARAAVVLARRAVCAALAGAVSRAPHAAGLAHLRPDTRRQRTAVTKTSALLEGTSIHHCLNMDLLEC